MTFKSLLFDKFGSSLSENTSMSKYSWFNLGGPAEYLFKPDNKQQLIEFLYHRASLNDESFFLDLYIYPHN